MTVKRGGVLGALVCVALLAALLTTPAEWALAADPAGGSSLAAGEEATVDITGHWTGAKLRCQKDEGRLVRCGTPTPFEIDFSAEGHGTSPDPSFPREFTWRWQSPTEIVIAPTGSATELKLFGVEREDMNLTFQAYIYPQAPDPSQPESRYVHYIFDINRAE